MSTLVSKVYRKLTRNDGAALARLGEAERQLVEQIRARKLTYLSATKLVRIVETCAGIREDGVAGDFVEAGCALGGSTILIATSKPEDRSLRVYDVFGMIPPPTSEDGADVHRRFKRISEGRSRGIGGEKYYGYEDDLLSKVRQNLADFGVTEDADRVELHQGLVQDTLTVDGPVAFAHIDVDWYEPVRTCLERIVPNLSVGGSVILDDYQDWSGCRRAVDEYFDGRADSFDMDDSAESLRVTRTAAGG